MRCPRSLVDEVLREHIRNESGAQGSSQSCKDAFRVHLTEMKCKTKGLVKIRGR